MYGGTHELVHEEFPSLGIEFTTVDPQDPAQWEQALRPNTKAGHTPLKATHRLKNRCTTTATAQNLHEHCLASGGAALGVAARHSRSAVLLRTPYLPAGTTPTKPADIQSTCLALRRLCCAAAGVLRGEHLQPAGPGDRPGWRGALRRAARPHAGHRQHLCQPHALPARRHGLRGGPQRNQISQRPL